MAHLPSLQTLRAFEAAGRLQSYSRAAEELGLTHGAVSHRIRELEQRLGRTLFSRVANTMVLTPAGAELMAQVRQGLSLLEQAFNTPRASAAKTTKQIVVSAVPSLAQTWLFTRMADFQAAHPDIDIALQVSERLVDFKKDGVDLGVRLGAGGWQGLNTAKLFDEELSPVCAPAYRDSVGLQRPADLARAKLLRNPWSPWARWFNAAGLDWPEPASGSSIDDSLLLLRAALRGDGVVLARRWLTLDDVKEGRLVRPFDLSIRDEFSYWLVWPMRRSERPGVAAFRDWLLAQAKESEAMQRP